jgi:hypothetical protein
MSTALRLRWVAERMPGRTFGFGVAVSPPNGEDGWWTLHASALWWRMAFHARPFYKDEEE